jgi:hypothetical protein
MWGPANCESTIYYSPVYLFPSDATINFGTVDIYWWQSNATPDAGPFQPELFLISPVGVSFDPPLTPFNPDQYLTEFSGLFPGIGFCGGGSQEFGYPSYGSCDPFNSYSENQLVYTMNGADSIQLAWFGPYTYTPPAPLPTTLPLFATGLAAIVLLGCFRRRAATACG